MLHGSVKAFMDALLRSFYTLHGLKDIALRVCSVSAPPSRSKKACAGLLPGGSAGEHLRLQLRKGLIESPLKVAAVYRGLGANGCHKSMLPCMHPFALWLPAC